MSLPANMATQAATRSTTWARCVKIKTRDGLIIALTEHDNTLAVNLSDGDGSQNYLASDGLEAGGGAASADLAVDAMEVIGAVDDARITRDDLHGGRYEGARVTIFEVEWSAPAAGQKIHFDGVIGSVATEGEEFTGECRSWGAIMGRPIGQTITEQCRKSFGSTSVNEIPPNLRCGVDLDPAAWVGATAYTAILAGDRLIGSRIKPTVANGYWYACTVAGTSDASSPPIEPTWPTSIGATVVDGSVTWTTEQALTFTGTVSGVTDRLGFAATGISVSASFLARGWIEWLTGNNATRGLKSPVATDDGAGALRLYRATLADIVIGDTFTIHAGCDKSQAACVVFSNWLHSNGFPHVPPRTV